MTILIEISQTALSDLRRRAEEGDSNAQYELGRIFMVGLGLSQDYQQAAKWYERAAEQGLDFSTNTAKECYAPASKLMILIY